MATSYFMLQFLRRKRAKSLSMNVPKHEDNISAPYSDCDLKEPKLSHDQYKNLCRICLKPGNIPIYSSKTPNIPDDIRTFGDIKIDEDDSYPKHICDGCVLQLDAAIAFRKIAQESEKLLLLLGTTTIGNITSELEDNCSDSNAYTIGTFKCETCNLAFSSLKDYSTHKLSKKHRNVRIQCHICHRLITAQLYKNHVQHHQSTTHLVCEVCGKLYRKDNLARHLQLHTYDLPFQCQLCPYSGRFMASIKLHMRTHLGDKPFSCAMCNQHFMTKSNLNRHLLTHGKDKPHKCKECGRAFYIKRDLDVHFKDHTGIKEYSCMLCSNKYSTRKAQMRHELRVHKREKMAKGRTPLYLQEEFKKHQL